MSSKSAIDFIGDIHGHCDELRALLRKLGYVETAGSFRYPRDERTVVFLGDYVDRGPQIRETLNLVRAMRDSGSAIALMGNHEFNMLSFWYKNGDGGRFLKNPGRGYLRKHTPRGEENLAMVSGIIKNCAPGGLCASSRRSTGTGLKTHGS